MMFRRDIFINKRRERGFTLIELVVASFIGAMVVTGAFVVLLGFRQQVKMAWAERAMDQYAYKAMRYFVENGSSLTDFRPIGVSQNYYAIADFIQGDLTVAKGQDTPTTTGISGSRTAGIIINEGRLDPTFPPTYTTHRRGVKMWDNRDTFELLYLGIEYPSVPATSTARNWMSESQIIVTVRYRYRHSERRSFGFLFGEDYARTRTYKTGFLMRNFFVEDKRHEFPNEDDSGDDGGTMASPFIGWSMASGKSAQDYLKDKWNAKHTHMQSVSLQ